MSTSRERVTVSILDKDYSIMCNAEESEALQTAARYLDLKMQGIRGGGKVVALERVAIMAALNITHDFLRTNDSKQEYKQSVQHEIEKLVSKVVAELN